MAGVIDYRKVSVFREFPSAGPLRALSGEAAAGQPGLGYERRSSEGRNARPRGSRIRFYGPAPSRSCVSPLLSPGDQKPERGDDAEQHTSGRANAPRTATSRGRIGAKAPHQSTCLARMVFHSAGASIIEHAKERKSGSHWTLCWRKPDSNHQSRGRPPPSS
jgi:hypothetical protein